MIYKDDMPDDEHVRITFELPSSLWAERVNVVGDFNDWDTSRHEMQQSRSNGNWRISLVLPRGHEYQFRYLINGRDWHNDWHADQYVPNRYGSDNSVVRT
jgi:1,4-alpha-glucan branching enzyme